MNAAEIYSQLLELDEHPRLEAKAGSQLGKSVLETVCAFSNEPGLGGGLILLGVKRVSKTLFDPTYEVVGVPDTDQVM